MTVLAPWGLLGLLAVPVLVALSLWRRQRRQVIASSLLLWQRVAEERRQAPAARQRRRVDPLLLLRVAIAVALAGALSGLAWVSPRSTGRQFVLVLDRSASMGTTDDGQTRLAACRERFLEAVQPHGQRDRIHLVLVPPTGAPMIEPTLSASEAEEALPRIDASHQAVADEALRAAARDAAGRWPQARIIVATDHRVDELPADAAVLAAGGPTENRGIVAFAARQRPDGTHEVLLRAANGEVPATGITVTLLADGEPRDQRELSLPPGGSAHAVFEADLERAAVLSARIEGHDALPADDQAWLARQLGPARVALIGDPSPALRRALAAARAQLSELVEMPTADALRPFDLAVYYRAVPRDLGGVPVVLVAPQGPAAGLQPQGIIEDADVTWMDRQDPLMQSVELAGLDLGTVTQTQGPVGMAVLARAGDTVLIGRRQAGDTALLYVGIDPAAGDWPLRPSFPIFWANVLATTTGAERGQFESVPPGSPCRLPLDEDAATVAGPDGPVPVAPGGVFRPPRVGLYRGGSEERASARAAVSLLSELETRQAGRGDRIQPPDMASMAAAETSRVWRLDGWLAAFALLLLLVHGRLAGDGLGPGRFRRPRT
jgi:hypothetical protein